MSPKIFVKNFWFIRLALKERLSDFTPGNCVGATVSYNGVNMCVCIRICVTLCIVVLYLLGFTSEG